MQGELRALVAELVRENLAVRLPAVARREVAAAFLSGALFELLMWSLEARPPTPAEEADALFHELAGTGARDRRGRELTAYARDAAPAGSVPDWFPAAFRFFFAGMWVLVTTLLGWLAGHTKLLARYPPVDEPSQEAFGWASGSMRWVSFNNALHVGLGPRGLHLAPNALFRPLFRRKVRRPATEPPRRQLVRER